MKKVLTLLSLVGLLSACGPQESMFSRLRKADKVEILYSAPGAEGGQVVMVTVEEIDGISNLIGKNKAEVGQCAVDGSIAFTKKDSVILKGDFSLAAECALISYEMEGKKFCSKLTPSSTIVLRNLMETSKKSKLDELAWFVGRWTQVEGPDLVSYEEWQRVSPTLYKGLSWTLYHNDTVHVETIDMVLEGQDIYYIPTVPENKGPVRFKMSTMAADSVVFENPAHDFPQKITYEARGDSMLMAQISGSKNGVAATKSFPLHRVVR